MKEIIRIAIDIGGTFTDTVIANQQNQILASAKTPTTPSNPTVGAVAGVKAVLDKAQKSIEQVTGFIHGTTLATNALIEKRGAKIASVTTAGFRDILEIGYERRYSQYDINIDKPDLLVKRNHCFTIEERISAQGKIVKPLHDVAISKLAATLKTGQFEAVAICLLHAYANTSHEESLRDQLQQLLPDISISISSEVSPEAREFDRLCTTIGNAYIQPLISRYLRDFVQTFKSMGLPCQILMMTASGGMTTIETAARLPIRLVESGPAGGAILASTIAAQQNLQQVLSFDMGGTTAKLCLIDQFQPQSSRHFEIARAARFIKGSGMPVRIPVTEMIEIGAGGGSIASVDSLQRLQIGPQSAGSDPGPACFGRGGKAPTVTDADVMLGYIDTHNFAEGRIAIDAELSKQAMATDIGVALNLSPIEGADGISQIVDDNMANASRMHAVESGKDLSTRTMIAFGGNGPLHATRVARRSGISTIVIPADPSVGSAVGFLFAPVSFEVVRSFYSTLNELKIDGINALFGTMIQQAKQVVDAGATQDQIMTTRFAFMRYHGQGHEIEVPLPDRDIQSSDIEELRHGFEIEYARQFSRAVPGMSIEILNWAVKVSTNSSDISENSSPSLSNHTQVTSDIIRNIYCDYTHIDIAASVYQRNELQPGHQIAGPALICEPQTTTLVSADFTATIDGHKNIWLYKINDA